ncbi:MAG: class I tRNA ligase family protein, partial [Patescibacteria group bacterium]
AMPFAQAHYPFAKKIPKSHILYSKFSPFVFPADYISEAVDQTRGWFYTLLAVAVLLGKGAPYKNVISLGHVLDKNGQKMSKSKGNVVDPWAIIQKYGVDVVRWYFYTVNPPGEPKKFDENDIGKISRQIIPLLYNSFVFLNTYDFRTHKIPKSYILNSKSSFTNILDQWVAARLNETILGATKKLNKYDISNAAKTIEDFVGDLSRWYIRRSRRRFQRPENDADYNNALGTLRFVLLETSKLIAPFVPFFSEALFKSLRGSMRIVTQINADSSVHLSDWPKANKKLIDKKLLEEMTEVRQIASLVLAKRAELGIRVRQPLASLKIRNSKSEIRKNKELLNILKDEVNVKNIVFDPKLKEEFELDSKITHKLREEGWFREFVRMVQGLRQDAKLEPKDAIVLLVQTPEELNFVLKKNETILKKEINAKNIEYGRSDKFTVELETKLDNWPIWVGLRKLT